MQEALLLITVEKNEVAKIIKYKSFIVLRLIISGLCFLLFEFLSLQNKID